MITIADFNMWIASNYTRKATNIAGRFSDQVSDPAVWARLSCEWHAAYQFGFNVPGDDVYYVDTRIQRRKSVDAMIANPPNTDKGRVLYVAWTRFAKDLAARRNEPPPVIEVPPPPPPAKPEPKPEPLPVEPKPEPKPEQPKQPGAGSWFMRLFAPLLKTVASYLLTLAWGAIKAFLLSKVSRKK